LSILVVALQIIGSLGVFLYGLKVMSEGLQKASGSGLRSMLQRATDNRISGTFSGFLLTCMVQSSSATTVMVVAFCGAGMLTLQQSLGVIFGANIGTTTTGWIVSLLGFKVKIAAFAVPLIGIGFFSQFITRWRMPGRVGQALVGFGLLFLGLSLLKSAIPDVQDSPQITEWLTALQPGTYGGLMGAILLGMVITVVLQSSSASMAITLTAAAKGYIDFPTACAITLGENIGTTVTAALAALGAPLVARRAALGHVLFNLLGQIWPILLFKPFLALVDVIVPGDPFGEGEDALLVAIPTHIAAFHTLFNVGNTLLFLPFTGPFERLIVRLMPATADSEDELEHELLYLTTPLGATPELAITAAQREVDRMAGVTLKMLARIRQALEAEPAELPRLFEKIQNHERATDALEHKINEYLALLVHGQLSTQASNETLSLLSMINDLERIGDHGEKVALLLGRMLEERRAFTPEGQAGLRHMAEITDETLVYMRGLILERPADPMPEAGRLEDRLNEARDRLRLEHLERLVARECDPVNGVIYTDLITSFEKMGDHAYNVAEAAAGIK